MTPMANRWSIQVDIDRICDRYEEDWRQGQPRPLDAYLAELDPSISGQLFQELVLVDRELRGGAAETPTWDDYRSRFPTFATEIEELRFQHEISTANGELEPSVELRLPGRVARFQLLDEVGRGAGGVVWKALDPRLSRFVALKLPHADRHWEDLELSRFFVEARAAAKLNHPNIVRVHEVDQVDKHPYIVSDFIDGQDLRQLLSDSTLTPRQAAALARDIARALQHAHDRGVIHRDIKPSNVLIDTAGCPYLADFGLAKDADRDAQVTRHGAILGTPAYMSPEQASGGAAKVDERTDVYSLGVVLYEMLTRQRPFSGQPYSLASEQLRSDPPRPRSIVAAIPRDLETICLKSIEAQPDARYESAAAMADDLDRYLAGVPVEAGGYGRLATAFRKLKRHPERILIVCLAGLSLAALSAAGLMAGRNDEDAGLQPIEITSDPPGAELVMVPLIAATFEPNPDRSLHIHGKTPFEGKAPPGHYLVVAALPDGRFHEVYRLVPEDTTMLPIGASHAHWKLTDRGTVQLSRVRIPPLDADQGMALVPQGSGGFYMDCHEFTVGEYQDLFGHVPQDLRWKRVPEDYAATANHYEACVVAERMGKRLPTAAEYQAAVSLCPVDVTPAPQLAARSALAWADDATSTVPPIFGLRSNVAEWTVTPPSHTPRGHNLPQVFEGMDMYQIVQPGSILVDGALPAAGFTTEIRVRYAFDPDLGFRCVRSAAPRFLEKP
ncbi:MAG: protein kinase [Planctomycetaceae bacterium]|nr:protein kinase [Planctomycetaceae bacterium]